MLGSRVIAQFACTMTIQEWRYLASLCDRGQMWIEKSYYILLARYGKASKWFRSMTRIKEALSKLQAHLDTAFSVVPLPDDAMYEPLQFAKKNHYEKQSVHREYFLRHTISEEECVTLFEMCRTMDDITTHYRVRQLTPIRQQQKMLHHIEREKRFAARMARGRVMTLILCATRYDRGSAFYRIGLDVVRWVLMRIKHTDPEMQFTTVEKLANEHKRRKL